MRNIAVEWARRVEEAGRWWENEPRVIVRDASRWERLALAWKRWTAWRRR